MQKFISSSLLVVILSALCSCNTIKGAGQDIQKGGEKLEKAAEKNK